VQASGNKITSETVWNELANNEGATGGGVSRYFALPSYQSSAGVPTQPQTHFAGRGVPDVAGDADPVTGYSVRVDGKNTVIGGTSAVAPLWAGLLALINQALGKPVGFVNPLLYQIGTSAFQDITQGNNGYYQAKAGWDACTGLGSPNGAALLHALQNGSTSTTNEQQPSEADSQAFAKSQSR
jgi:kumamolisin